METVGSRTRCIGCGGNVPEMEGPTHRYLESSPGCWQIFGRVLALEYSDPSFGRLHRLTVDSYAVQHPGRPSPQTVQSQWLHLISLCVVVERGLAGGYATRVMGAAARAKRHFAWLTPPQSLGEITVVDVVDAATVAEHEKRVRTWAESAWSAWAAHHGTVRGWIASRE
jgi:hypothetical protein